MGILDRGGVPEPEFDHEVYYGNKRHDDLAKMREEAERRQRGDSYKKSESTRLHHHGYNESCKDHVHEQWGKHE
jgi:hypothetical protein